MSITGNWDRRISRQTFLGISGMSAAALVLGAQGVWLPRRGLAQTTTDSNPFKPLGVASGDPLLNSVVLWTRLAPDPLNGGGMPDGEVTVDWEVASDSSFSDASRVRSGQYTAKPDLAHSVHVDAGVEGTGDTLKPATTYYYRFEVDKKSDGTYAYTSPTGRTKTAPDPNASSVSRMKFAFVSCQHWESDLYPTYGHIAAQPDLDLVVHLGDYIYEGAPSSGKVTRKNPDGTYSYHSAVADPSFGCTTLADYRNRHAQYKTDQILQAAHAAHPWAVTWDDHEVENDYAGTNSWYSRAILPRGGLPPTRPTTSTGTGPGTGTRKPGTATLPPVTASSNTSRITRCPPIVLSGDMHCSWAANLEADFNNRSHSDVVGAEFIGTSISSGLSSGWDATYRKALKYNQHVKMYDGRTGGYVLCTIDESNWTSDYLLANSLSDSNSSMKKWPTLPLRPVLLASRKQRSLCSPGCEVRS